MSLAWLPSVRTGCDEDLFTTFVTRHGEPINFTVFTLMRLDDFRIWRDDDLVEAWISALPSVPSHTQFALDPDGPTGTTVL
jgi:hypothetical protein